MKIEYIECKMKQMRAIACLVLSCLILSSGCIEEKTGETESESTISSLLTTSISRQETSTIQEFTSKTASSTTTPSSTSTSSTTLIQFKSCKYTKDCNNGEVCSTKGCITVESDEVYTIGDMQVWRVGGKFMGYFFFISYGNKSHKFKGKVNITINDWRVEFDKKGNSRMIDTPLYTDTFDLKEEKYRFMAMKEIDESIHRDWAYIIDEIHLRDFTKQPEEGFGTFNILYTNTEKKYSIEFYSNLMLLQEDEYYEGGLTDTLSALILSNRDVLGYKTLTRGG